MAKISWVIAGMLLCAPAVVTAQDTTAPEQIGAAPSEEAEAPATEEEGASGSTDAPAVDAEAEPDVEVVVPAGPGDGDVEPDGAGPEDPAEVPEGVAGDEDEDEDTPASEPEAADAGEDGDPGDEEEAGLDFFIDLHGAYRVRSSLMDDIPLTALPSRGFEDRLGQRWWVSQWFRIGAEIGLRGHAQIITELDVARGLLAGDFTNGVTAAERPRSDVDFLAEDGLQLRKVYLEWRSQLGLLRAGLMPSHWGYGILANDGDHPRAFGDPDFGDRVLRLAFATKPFGESMPIYGAIGGDIVYRDLLADFSDGDRAYQGVLALWYQDEERRVGFYLARRWQEMPVDDGPTSMGEETSSLGVFALDVFARWDWAAPSGGTIRAGLEGALIYGSTDTALTVSDLEGEESFDDIRQFLLTMEVGYASDETDVSLEAGYTSGDSNAEDDFQRRATMDPDHQVGLILFPEVMAWQTARSSTLATSPELFGRPARGADLLPTNGGVAGAMYLFPTWRWQATDWMQLRLGAVWARATSDVVDPYRQRSESRAANYRGGDASNRDLGLELDGALLFQHELNHGIRLTGGLEGGYFMPGRAFDDASGTAMASIGLLRARFGMEF